MARKTNTAGTPAPAVTPVTVAEATVTILRNDGRCAYFAEGTLGEFASVFQPFMATPKSRGNFDAYVAHARQWRIGYEMARLRLPDETDPETVKLSDASIDAFTRRIREAKAQGLLKGEKPRSQSAAAGKKAEQRKKAADITGTPAQWRAAAADAIGKGDVAAAEAALRNARTLERKADADAKAKAAAATKDAAESLRASIAVLRSAGDAKALNTLAAQAKKLAAPHLKKAAKA